MKYDTEEDCTYKCVCNSLNSTDYAQLSSWQSDQGNQQIL